MDEKAINEQLSRIFDSAEFINKPQLCKFLKYLVNKYLSGEGSKVKAYTIATELFGHGEQFSTDHHALVRIYAGRLRRSLKMYYLEEGKNESIVIEIPKGNYCPKITNRKQEQLKSETVPFAITNENPYDNSIAVLPFKNHSNENDLDHLALGFSIELSDTLTKYQELKVIGINKNLNGAISETELMELFRNKGINFLIDGEIIAFASQVKISFRLLHMDDNSQIWADDFKFDRKKDNLFDIQEKVSKLITSHIWGAYGHVNKKRFEKLVSSKPKSLNEQELLLKYYHSQTVLSPEIIQDFHKSAFEVLEKEPSSVIANALVASINSTIYSHDLSGAKDAYIKFGELAEKAFNLNANHKLAFSTLASKCFYYDEKDRLYRLFEEGQKWLPNTPLGLGLFGLWFSYFGEWEYGKELIDKVFEDNVFVPSWYYSPTCFYYYRQKDYEKAIIEATKLQLTSTFVGPIHRIPPLAQLGRLNEAKKEFENLLKHRPDFINRGRYLLKMHIKEDSLVEHLLEGFEKIGVKVS